MTTPIDIVIVSFNTREDTLACLASIAAASPSAIGEIHVVDNASTDGTVAAVRTRFPNVRTSSLERNVGFGAANNVAIRISSAPLILLLNSDTLVPRGAIEGLVERLGAMDATAAGPRLVDDTGRVEISFGAMLSPWNEAVQLLRQRASRSARPLARAYVQRLLSRERFVDWVSGACLLVRREAAIEAGLFDVRYFLYEEDVDFCAALRARGGRILFTPAVEVVHLRGRSQRSVPRAGTALSHYDRSHLAFYDKHAPRWAPLLRWWVRLRR